VPWRRAAAPSAIWPVRRRLVRDPDVCAGHDTVGLMAQELAAWHAMLAKMRQFAAELAVSRAPNLPSTHRTYRRYACFSMVLVQPRRYSV